MQLLKAGGRIRPKPLLALSLEEHSHFNAYFNYGKRGEKTLATYKKGVRNGINSQNLGAAPFLFYAAAVSCGQQYSVLLHVEHLEYF